MFLNNAKKDIFASVNIQMNNKLKLSCCKLVKTIFQVHQEHLAGKVVYHLKKVHSCEMSFMIYCFLGKAENLCKATGNGNLYELKR